MCSPPGVQTAGVRWPQAVRAVCPPMPLEADKDSIAVVAEACGYCSYPGSQTGISAVLRLYLGAANTQLCVPAQVSRCGTKRPRAWLQASEISSGPCRPRFHGVEAGIQRWNMAAGMGFVYFAFVNRTDNPGTSTCIGGSPCPRVLLPRLVCTYETPFFGVPNMSLLDVPSETICILSVLQNAKQAAVECQLARGDLPTHNYQVMGCVCRVRPPHGRQDCWQDDAQE